MPTNLLLPPRHSRVCVFALSLIPLCLSPPLSLSLSHSLSLLVDSLFYFRSPSPGRSALMIWRLRQDAPAGDVMRTLREATAAAAK